MFKGNWQIDGDGVSGWASSDESSAPVWVEMLVDGQPMGIAYANLANEEGGGFWLNLPAPALEGGSEIRVRIANTDYFLEERKNEKIEKPSLVSEFQIDRGNTIGGWAFDSAHSDEKLKIFALLDGQVITETMAAERRYRPAMADGHGFTLTLPPQIADGISHDIYLKDNKGRNLKGSPVRLRILPKSAKNWFEEQKKPDKPALKIIAGMLQTLEERLPGALAQANYEDWKKAFPIEAASRQKAVIALPGEKPSSWLKSQNGVEIRINAEKAEYYFSQGAAKSVHPYMLAHLLETMRKTKASLVYADGDGQFKPAWNRETFWAQDYLGPFLASAEAVQNADLSGSDDEDTQRVKIALAAERLGKIFHLPMPLSSHELVATAERQQAVARWLNGNLPGISWQDGRIRYEPLIKPRISIIVPTRDRADLLSVCLQGLKQTSWPDYEILIIDNGSEEEDALTLLKRVESEGSARILRRPGVFNYARLNNEAVLEATGEYICFLNNDTQALHPEWLTELAALLTHAGDGGGCVGAKLLWPNNLVQHGGVIVGVNQLAAHVGNRWLEDEPGYMGRNQFAQQYSAVTAACMLTKRDLFLESGGYDERRFPIAFNDADYCLRLREKGKKIFWTPHSRLMHHESASRGKDILTSARHRSEREMAMFRSAWGHYEDPFYNPNLPLSSATEPFMGLAFPPRPRIAR